MKEKIKIFLKISIPVFLIIHILGWWRFYYELNFYDEIVHFLAGASVFFVLFWWLKNKDISFLKKTFICLGGLFLITIFWETGEYFIDNVLANYVSVGPLQLGLFDTITDCIANFTGAMVAMILVYFKG